MSEPNEQFYDVVDSEGNLVASADEEKLISIDLNNSVSDDGKEKILDAAESQVTPESMPKLRKMYMTVKHPRVIACQHRLDLGRQPRHRNCESCWYAFFANHKEVVDQLHEMHTNEQDEAIVALQGKKFLHRWRQFMATIIEWSQQTETQEINGEVG